MIRMRIKKGSLLSPNLRKRKFTKLKRAALDKKIFSKLSETAIELIFTRVKKGYASKKGIRGKFNPLSPAYINTRKGKRKTGKKGQRLKSRVKPQLGSYTTPSKANLTWTGQMLENIGFKAFKSGFRIFIKNTGRTLMGGGKDKNTNKQIAEYVSKKRPFLDLAKAERKVIISEFRQHVKDVARKIFN